jgi:hypothetical protein
MGQVRYRGQGAQLTQVAIFKQIWIRLPKKSFISGLFLREYEGTDLFPSCFAHVLAKGQNKYSLFKYLAKNIALLTPHEHHLLDAGTENQRISYALDIEEKTGGKQTCDWKKLYDLRDELIKEYKEIFPSTFFGIINYKYDPDEVIAKIGPLNKSYFESLDHG